ncbi:tRNA (guanosine(18)-2'-O)-methyltransferase [Acidipropionibacterium virtanenii]|uniref:tRNA (Guanosine(18)-2'-O)-methyltransferase n=1 Tax=Acidipropionibacterium virtanenii TaxID=2057246 RepID=A0A344UVZ5_9ACTN|nr:tRNA (guanosine(18)-2'-O)-methyltransferase [Acidipropionibacterium virtanenii]
MEGSQAVREALGWQGRMVLLATSDPDRDESFVRDAQERGVRVAGLSPADVSALSETVTSQGLFAVCSLVAGSELPALDAPELVVICAQVRDPGNAGTVIRCADAFGAAAVVLTKGSVDPHNSKTVRASVGSVFHLPVITGVGLEEAVGWARDCGLQVLAADGGGHSLDELARQGRLSAPTAWLMGNEAWGLPEEQRALADEVVGVPMWGAAESLNLSTAAAVCLYTTASAQRGGED